ncbi:MAG: hypothetical protein ACOCWA_01855 [Bacteroidota bacterium]
MKTLSIGLILLHMILTSFSQAKSISFEEWDQNKGDKISPPEFVEVFVQHFLDAWGTGKEGYFDPIEGYKAMFDIWGIDDDGALIRQEWLQGKVWF